MEKIVFLVFVALAASQAAVVPRPEKNDWAILRCENGTLKGMDNLIHILQETVATCGDAESPKQLFPCLAEAIGVMSDDGVPDVDQMDHLLSLTFSETILQDLPDMKESYLRCGQAFANSYNLLATDDNEDIGIQEFFLCAVRVTHKYKSEIPKVCAYEFQFNGQ